MDTTRNTIVNSNFASEFVLLHWGIESSCSSLRGYAEHNFRVESNSGKHYLLKIPFDQPELEDYDFQYLLLEHLHSKGLIAPRVIPTSKGSLFASQNLNGKVYTGRLLTWLEGNTLDQLDRRPVSICRSLGTIAAENTIALGDFQHPYGSRYFQWNTDHGIWVKSYLHLYEENDRNKLNEIISQFEENKSKIDALPHSIIHNDINECNVLIKSLDFLPIASALIDYGDAIYSSSINNLAICLAYAFQCEEDILSVAEHVIDSYCQLRKVTKEECQQLYVLVGMRLTISLTGAAISKIDFPDSAYHQNNVAGSWLAIDRLQAVGIVLFEEACLVFAGLSSSRLADFEHSVARNQKHLHELFGLKAKHDVQIIDLGLESDTVPHPDNLYYEEDFAIAMNRMQAEYPRKLLLGGYGEVRNFYTTEAFAQRGLNGHVHRTKHLGIDIWRPQGTAIHALWDSKVYLVEKNDFHKDYGVVVVLKHHVDRCVFYTLYGHLSEETYNNVEVGQTISEGDKFGTLGSYKENGHWFPHLHFQIILDLLGRKSNFDGVARPDQWSFMSNVCPNPSMIFEEKTDHRSKKTKEELLLSRKANLGQGLSLSYNAPLHIVRGSDVFLIDAEGQKYLDTVNNVSHVGHENYEVVSAVQKQLSKLNTNSRYLSQAIIDYAEALSATFPDKLSVLHFTNSGSEANELALRMAKTHTRRENILAIEVGYHGNTQGTINISSYKFDAKGGKGRPRETYLLDLPDRLRGKHQGKLEDVAKYYIQDAIEKIKSLKADGIEFAAFIHESILSCGGQIVLPPGYLKAIYAVIRELGGVVIADEVQVGFGRVGEHYWGFELQDVIPDIVVMGKPIGNGHPLGAVICTEEIARSFDNGMEYFNTFGGNPVSAVAGLAVLKEIEEKELQQNAWLVGNYLKSKLRFLQEEFSCIAEVRGHGLFLGIEFLDKSGNPAADLTTHIANEMSARKILMSTDGPGHNVLKIKPPLTFQLEHADILVSQLREVLNLAFCC